MIIIKNIKAKIKDAKHVNFGFDFSFNKGLNIITGYNSSGKSTVLSCIYYCLGMEQLLGSHNADGLDDCLKKEFKYDGKIDYKVFSSYTEVTIQNEKGEIAEIKRHIKGAYNEPLNNIYIKENGKTITKFLHSKGDSDSSEGFYQWLAEFISLEIPQYDSRKILYLQHIFACALVEQTKGWSDFFSQIPNFSVNKPKQKIVEYSLGLSGLIDEFKIDLLKKEEKELKQNWSNNISSFKTLTESFNVELPNLAIAFSASVSPTKIDKLKLYVKSSTGAPQTIDTKLDELDSLYTISVKKNEAKVTKEQDSQLFVNNDKLKSEIYQLNKQLSEILFERTNELNKQRNYEKVIESRQKEIETLESLSKIKSIKDIDIKDVSNCPVCNSSLLREDVKQLKNQDKIDTLGSVAFYKSEKKLYESYIKNSYSLMERFEKVKLYYENQISNKKMELDELTKDLINDSRIPSRADIAHEIFLKTEIDKYRNIQNHLKILKDQLKPISTRLAVIRHDFNEIKSALATDEDILNKFKKHFKFLLKEFDFSNELLTKIILNKEDPQKLLPTIYNGADEKPQPIRLKSSASDFIRSLWAFYLSLLSKSENHVGFLILDEPGQHAMDKESMKSLLKHTSSLKNRQVILAISKNRPKKNEEEKTDTRKTYLEEILGSLKEKDDYTLNIIEDNGRKDKCVQKLN
jgi:DNA repair exonuclease SbcCD ATPase subunit